MKVICRYWFFDIFDFHKGGIAVKLKIYELVIVNILVLILHGASVWWKQPIRVSETRTYALSCSVDKCIYILFLQARIIFKISTHFLKISLAAP